MIADPIDVLRRIVNEVAGPGDRICDFSSLPAHLVFDAREAIESSVPTSAQDAHVELLLARLRKADETIVSLRSEIDHLRRVTDEAESKLAALVEANAELDRKIESAASRHLVFAPYERLAAYDRRQECDA
jgi:hypothetical protein